MKEVSQEELEVRFLFGANVYRARKMLKLSQGELANQWDMAQSALARIEVGQNARFSTIAFCAKQLGIEPYQLLLPLDQALTISNQIKP